MELIAFLNALIAAREYSDSGNSVVVLTDSAYIFNSFDKGWLNSWATNNWRNSKGAAVKNDDLWKEILKSSQWLNFSIEKVKAHNGNKFNEIADKEAVLRREEYEILNNTRNINKG